MVAMFWSQSQDIYTVVVCKYEIKSSYRLRQNSLLIRTFKNRPILMRLIA